MEGDGSELVGDVIDGRYRLDATLGRGGMGLVYRATHVGMRRPVAVKILHPSLAASPEVRSRFEREALAVGKIDHPNCVATYDVGRLPDGALYLAMELLEGRSLADVLEQERQIAPGRALHILAHVLRGLGAVHAAGLIHRDIKPENIFLIRVGDDLDFAKILDFGIAKPMSGELSDDGVRLTQAGMAFGTPIYMAPEQALGNPMDGRADLYAAAVIGYEMLCGQPPFYSDDKLEVMSMHTAKPVPPMRSRLVKGGKPVPSSIEKLIVRGLTKKPADRYPSAEVFLAAVESALKTSDGGQTDVLFERPESEETGARPLLGDDGEVRMDTEEAFPPEDRSDAIANDIDEILSQTPTVVGKPYVPQRSGTPGRGNPATAKAPAATPERGSGRIGTRLGVDPAPATLQPPVVAAGEPRGRLGGGVGIGIPYTGPKGEPIFGLTPEQRLAQVPKKKRWPLYAGILGAAIIGGIAIAIFTKPSSGEDRLDPATPAGAAAQALERGDATRALQILDANKAAVANDPDAQLEYGHAYAALRHNGDALAAYDRALALDPAQESDKVLRANLRVMAADPNGDILMHAFDLWVGHTHDPEARPALSKAAVSDQIVRRHAVRPVIDRYKLGEGIEWFIAYSYDLEQEETCSAKKEAVAHLRALSDPRGIPALERILTKKTTTRVGGKLRPVYNYPCLVDDAKEAIGYLNGYRKGLKGKP
ncbi:MAG: protein kinase domain-containing protein [Acidobacteriota bacterium]